LTRMAAGLWQFGVAAQDGSGGGTVRVRVQYDGVTLGKEQALPIGPDLFMATEGVTAHGGGCGVQPATTASGSWWWVAAAAAMAAAARRARRRAT